MNMLNLKEELNALGTAREELIALMVEKADHLHDDFRDEVYAIREAIRLLGIVYERVDRKGSQ